MPRPPKSRQCILAAAERIFAERGLAGARTEQIASAAGVNKAMLHYYFGTKEKLYHDVIDDLIRQFREKVLQPIAATPSPTTALFEYVDLHTTFLATHPTFPRLIQRAMMTGGPHLRALIQHFHGPALQCLRKILRAGIRRGEFRRVDVDNTIVSLVGGVVFYFIIAPVTAVILRHNPYHKSLVAKRKRALKDLIHHGLLTPSQQKKLRARKPKAQSARSRHRKEE